MQTNATHWQTLPGSYDAVHAGQLFPARNPYGLPDLTPVPLSATPDWLVPYGQRVRSDVGLTDGAVHFFLDDYRFESVWSRPRKALQHLSKYATLLTPDFSVYLDYPSALQLWNIYRNRWCGALWQSLGFVVIPTVAWALPESYDFCFAGLPERSLLAVSTVGTHKQMSDRQRFLHGFEALLERLAPTRVLCYGQPHPEMSETVDLRCYPARWQGVRWARKV